MYHTKPSLASAVLPIWPLCEYALLYLEIVDRINPTLMKRTVLLSLIALGLAQGGRAANLVWTPTTAVWDTLPATTNWKDTNTSATVAFTQGDSVLFDDSGLGQPAVTLSGTLSPSYVLVDSASQYSLASTTGGNLSGGFSLVKRGSGLLILDANNAISGPTSIEAGQLQIGTGSSRGTVGSGPITNLSGLIVNRTGTLTLNNYLSGSGGFTNRLGATVNIWGTNTMSGPILVQVGLLALSNAPAQGTATDIILDASPTATANSRLGFAGGINLPSSAVITMLGTAGAGPSRCTITTTLAADTTTNSVNGPILVGSGNGLIQLTATSTGTGLLAINGNISNHPDNVTAFAGSLYIRGNLGNGLLSGSFNLPGTKLIKDDTGTWTISSSGNSASSTLVASGTLRLGANNALPNVEFSMGKAGVTPVLDLAGYSQQIPALNDAAGVASPTSTIGNSSTTSDSVLTLADGGAYTGVIQDSVAGGTRKVGLTILAGAVNAQQLRSVCTYSGPTTLQGGGLALVGAGDIPNSTSIQFSTGTSLDVRYKDAAFVLQSAQTLKGDGTFHINGSCTSQGTIELKVSKSGGTVSSDNITMDNDGTINYGGTLKLDLSGETLNSADVIQLFTANPGRYAGAFTSIVPATPGAGMTWNTTMLTTDGTLRIDASIPTTPTNITFAVVGDGTQMELAWPDSYKGWTLQGQTNVPVEGLTTNWFDVPESAATNRVLIPINPANGSVFYRLSYQP
jgi:autotransporter-associated beta strand protein